MAQPATKRRKLSNQQRTDEEYPCNNNEEIKTVRLKSKKRGFFKKTRTCKQNNDNNIENTNNVNNGNNFNYDRYDNYDNYNYNNYGINDTTMPIIQFDNKVQDDYGLHGLHGFPQQQAQAQQQEANNISDRDEMANICDDLGIAKGVHVGVKLYGFVNHLVVYQEIFRLTQIDNDNERHLIVRGFNSNKLRDIKSKIQSEGKTGKKHEMIQGICKKLIEFIKYYQKNNQINNTMHAMHQNENENQNETHNDFNGSNSYSDPYEFPPQIEHPPHVQIDQQNEARNEPINEQINQAPPPPPVDFVEQNTGSNGAQCDGCGLTKQQYLEYEGYDPQQQQQDNNIINMDMFLKKVCPICKYGVCQHCQADAAKGTCFCKDSNFGLNPTHYYETGNTTLEQGATQNALL